MNSIQDASTVKILPVSIHVPSTISLTNSSSAPSAARLELSTSFARIQTQFDASRLDDRVDGSRFNPQRPCRRPLKSIDPSSKQRTARLPTPPSAVGDRRDQP